MNHSVLKEIILDQHEVIRNAVIIPREYSFEPNANYILTGLRRAGKSTMLYHLVRNYIKEGMDWNQIIYINFEDERLYGFTLQDFNDIIGVQAELCDKKGLFFLDEIQNIEGWEKFARRLADSGEHVYITGSNAKMLSRDMETVLGGRYLTKYIAPYNFRELLTAENIGFTEKDILQTRTSAVIRREADNYLQYGGLPEALRYQDKREYISSVYQKILLGDIASRNNIRNTNALKLMMKKLAESVKDEISFSRLCNLLKEIGLSVSKDSLIDYVGYAADAYLLFPIKNYFSRFAVKESTPKYYFTDNGILSLFLTDKKTILLENLIAIALREKYKEDIYYLKSEKTGIDIDFYLPEENTAIQVAYSLSNISNSRETDNLIRLAKSSSPADRYIILTYEEEEQKATEGVNIEIMPIWKWLLSL